MIIEIKLIHSWASLVAQMANNPPAMWETATQGCNVPSLGWEDLLEEGMALPVSCLENPHAQWGLVGCNL